LGTSHKRVEVAGIVNLAAEGGIPKDTVFAMWGDGKPWAEIMAFLDHEIVELGVKELMAERARIGKPITEEHARNRVKAFMNRDD
jgi:hypothetical protein